MRAIITIQHPAHVHFFRNTIEELQSDGHEIRVLARQKEIALELLNIYDLEYTVTAMEHEGLLSLPRVQVKHEWDILKEAKKFNPDVLAAIGEPAVAHVAKLIDANSIIFTDTEHARLQNMLAFPFVDRVCTPDCYIGDIGEKQIRYPSYHELAYLHPERFEPDPTILNDIGLSTEDRFVILRTVDWNAVHDIGDSGINNITSVVTALENMGVQVFITAESEIPETIEHCKLRIEPHRIHHLMYYADLFLGESATMATESAVLGTPAIFVSTIPLGYTDELEEEYELVFNFSGPQRHNKALSQAISILQNNNQSKWRQRRKELLEEKIDTTKFILKQIRAIQT